jgi:hypothetical protein
MASYAPRLGDMAGDMDDFGDAVALCESAGVGDREAGGVDASRSESEPTTPNALVENLLGLSTSSPSTARRRCWTWTPCPTAQPDATAQPDSQYRDGRSGFVITQEKLV